MSASDSTPADEHRFVWLVCHTRPRCEKKFAALLKAEGFEHFLAIVQSVKRYRNQTKRFTKPLFPGYVFACVPPLLKSRLYQQDLLARAIIVLDEKLFLHQLAAVKTLLASGFEVSLIPQLTKGRRVKVAGGPLHGVEGLVDNAENPSGIVLSIDVLQQGLLVRVPVENLELLP